MHLRSDRCEHANKIITKINSVLSRLVVALSLLLGAGLTLVQPCAAASFQFDATGSLHTARFLHTATLLSSGQVLVAGGYGKQALASAELYDPATGTWTTTGSLALPRDAHTETLLPNGRVLVAAGPYTRRLVFNTAELYERMGQAPTAQPTAGRSDK